MNTFLVFRSVFCSKTFNSITRKKSHTCEEGGAQLKWTDKKQSNFNIYNVVFF